MENSKQKSKKKDENYCFTCSYSDCLFIKSKKKYVMMCWKESGA